MEQKEILLKDQILEIPNFLDLRTLVKFLKYINKLDSEKKFADASSCFKKISKKSSRMLCGTNN